MKKISLFLSIILLVGLYAQAQQKSSTAPKKVVIKKPKKPVPPLPPLKPTYTPPPIEKNTSSEPTMVLSTPASPMAVPVRDNQDNQLSNNQVLTAEDIITTKVSLKVNTADKLLQDALLVYGSNGTVVSFDVANKKANWIYKEPNIDNNSANRFTVENATAYVPFVDGTTTALNLNTGKVYWKAKIGLNRDKMLLRRQTALTSGNLLYLASKNSNIYAIDKINGDLKWNYKLQYEYNIYPPIVANNEVFINNAPYIYKFDAQSGKAIWQRNFGKAMYAKMVTDGKRVYATDESRTLFAIDPSNKSTINWEFNLTDNQYGVNENIMIDNGTVYLAGKGNSSTSSVYALNAEDGKMIWKTDLPAEEIETLNLINGKIVGYLKDQLFVLESKTGKEIIKVNPTEKPISNIIAIGDQTLLYVSKNGIVTYNLTDKKFSSIPVAALKTEKTDNQTNIQWLKAN